MPSSVVRMVTRDHERLDRLLRRMCADGPSRDRWRAEFSSLLMAHRLAEREELLSSVLTEVPTLEAPVRDLAARDAILEQLVTDLQGTDIERPEFTALCDRATQVLADHAGHMARVVLAPLEQLLPRREIRRLGGEYEQRRERELRRVSDHEPPPRRLDLSRAELYEMARRAGVEGRSSMSRAELIDELRRRQP
jgi:hypothetical protein